MATFKQVHKLQLRQLRTIDPTAHQQAITMLGNGFMADAVSIIKAAMQAALTRLTAVDPAEAIYTALVAHIEAGRAISPRGLTPLWQNREIQAHLRRDNDDRLRVVVYRNCIPRSTYVGHFGRDLNHVSSSRSGCWKVAKEAKANIETLVGAL